MVIDKSDRIFFLFVFVLYFVGKKATYAVAVFCGFSFFYREKCCPEGLGLAPNCKKTKTRQRLRLGKNKTESARLLALAVMPNSVLQLQLDGHLLVLILL